MSMAHLARDIASRLHHRGTLICPQHSDVAADLREIASANLTDQKATFDARKLDILSSYGMSDCVPTIEKPFAYANGIAVIPIHGLLINRLSWSYSFATGYNFIRSQMNAALADDDVQLIVYDVNTPGGVASGCAELAREMYDSRSEKPSLAVVDARCYSAGVFLATACGKVVVTPSGGFGGIGCFAMHADYSEMLNTDGIKITFIEAPSGGEKTDGHPYKPLSAKALATIQRDVDYHYGLFVEAVARHRGMSEDDIRATQAGVFLPPEALDLGLIDAMETPAEAVASFFNEITSDAEAGDDEMTQQNGSITGAGLVAPQAAATTGPVFTQADIDAAASRAVQAALSADRTRQSAIRTCDEAKGREKLANHLASDTEMTVEAAKAVLSAAATETPPEPTAQPSGFAAAMAGTQNPGIKPDGNAGQPGTGAQDDTPESRAARILGAYNRATGTVIDMKPAAAA